jgi:hypothetical protein
MNLNGAENIMVGIPQSLYAVMLTSFQGFSGHLPSLGRQSFCNWQVNISVV